MDYKSNSGHPYKPRYETKGRIEVQLKDDPEVLTTEEVSNIKLSTLSKNLGSHLSSRKIIDIYLRWLEAKRTAHHANKVPTWETVQRQWISALKGRGFSEGELIKEVKQRQVQGHAPPGRAELTENLIRSVFRESRGKQPPSSELQSRITTSDSQPTERKSLKRSAASLDRPNDHEERRDENIPPNKYAKHSDDWENRVMNDHPTVPPVYYTCKRCHIKG